MQGSHHVPVGIAADYIPRTSLWRFVTAETSPDRVNEIGRQMREIAQCLVLDLSFVAIAAAKQVGLIDPTLVGPSGSGYVNRSISPCHSKNIRI
jgi:hypothetical protein